MNPSAWDRAKSLLAEAAELPPAAREQFVLDRCPDPAMRREMLELFGSPAALSDIVSAGALAPGARLGAYVVEQLLGRGGMGEVYRARDANLGRDVAIKVLPPMFTADRERLARFAREARVLASLNHPHIGAIYGVEDADGMQALVLELIEGETLADRLARGAIPTGEALSIARQIAQALEAAHEKGIVHRDLKPANIKITPAGTVKVLDFGLAQAGDPGGTDLQSSPDIGITREGTLLGTVAYMSPEQARGHTVDKRTDMWAFGSVLYEMLTGAPAFSGSTVSDHLAAILEREPDWSALPARTPVPIHRLLRRLLKKDRTHRLDSASDARLEIDDALTATDTTPGETGKRWLPWTLLAVALVSLAVVGTRLAVGRVATLDAPEYRVEIATPATNDPFSMAVSPDGRQLVFAGLSGGVNQLWLRPLASTTAKPLTGTVGGSQPFWSPDNTAIGFFADGALKRLDLTSGSVQMLASAPGCGGTWNRQGVIVFSPSCLDALYRIPSTGGTPVAVTDLGPAHHLAHQHPVFLPDGRHLLFYAPGGGTVQGVYVAALDSGKLTRLIDADSPAIAADANHLLFVKQGTLFTLRFDSSTLEIAGDPVPVVEGVAFDTGLSAFSASPAGVLAYRAGEKRSRQMASFDRDGASTGALGDRDTLNPLNPALSPDGRTIAEQRSGDIWLLDVARGVLSRATFGGGNNWCPIWSPDGTRIVFASDRQGILNLYEKMANSSSAEKPLLESSQAKIPVDWSHDGRFIIYRALDANGKSDLWILPLNAEEKPFPFLKTGFDEREAQFSPDDRLVAYQSDESGRFEVYVRPFRDPGPTVRVSLSGGAQPRWAPSGAELFYIALDGRLMAVSIVRSASGASIDVGSPRALFPVNVANGPLPGANRQQYMVSENGRRFLVNMSADGGVASAITLILNWRMPADAAR